MLTPLMPVVFLGHGSPMNALEQNTYTDAWQQLGQNLPRPKAILCLSAHFAGDGSLAVTVDKPQTIHDFYGFSQQLFDMQYPAPGSPALAQRVMELLPEARATDKWGLDHGAWSVLVHLYPRADIPVVQLSLDLSLQPEQQMALGARLALLREEGVLILGSGNVVHNLRLVNPRMQQPFPWALDFDRAIADLVQAGDFAGVAKWPSLPGARESVPTTEHYVPLLYVLGAAGQGELVKTLCQQYVFGSLSMTGFVIG